MVRGNDVIPNQHFRKSWDVCARPRRAQRRSRAARLHHAVAPLPALTCSHARARCLSQTRVRTWFSQPARKLRRREGAPAAPGRTLAIPKALGFARRRRHALNTRHTRVRSSLEEGQGGLPSAYGGRAAAGGALADATLQHEDPRWPGLHPRRAEGAPAALATRRAAQPQRALTDATAGGGHPRQVRAHHRHLRRPPPQEPLQREPAGARAPRGPACRAAQLLTAAPPAPQENAKRLKAYKAKLVLFPRRSKKPKARRGALRPPLLHSTRAPSRLRVYCFPRSQHGDSAPEELSVASQLKAKLLPITKAAPKIESVAVTAEMKARAPRARRLHERFGLTSARAGGALSGDQGVRDAAPGAHERTHGWNSQEEGGGGGEGEGGCRQVGGCIVHETAARSHACRSHSRAVRVARVSLVCPWHCRALPLCDVCLQLRQVAAALVRCRRTWCSA